MKIDCYGEEEMKDAVGREEGGGRVREERERRTDPREREREGDETGRGGKFKSYSGVPRACHGDAAQ